MSDPLPAPQFNLEYNVRPMDIGAGYAAGISQAGKSIGDAISSVSNIYTQNRNADDILQAMQQNKMISSDEYNAVANKSLGAKQQLLGLYASEYAAQQGQQRAIGQIQAKGQVDVATQFANLQNQIKALQAGYGQLLGVKPGQVPIHPQQQVRTAPAVAPQVQAASPAAVSPSDIYSGSPALATQGVAGPKLNTGPTISKDQLPPGAKIGTLRGTPGALMPDGTFRPFQ